MIEKKIILISYATHSLIDGVTHFIYGKEKKIKLIFLMVRISISYVMVKMQDSRKNENP